MNQAELQAVYQSAKAPSKWALDSVIAMTLKKSDTPALFVVRSGTLYLLVQTTVSRWHLVTQVKRQDWSAARLQAVFCTEELWNLLPDPSAENGGIPWIDTTGSPEDS
jgi:hypothetical protein